MIRLTQDCVFTLIVVFFIEISLVFGTSNFKNGKCKMGETCNLPDCLCRSTNPPRLNRTRVPQIVLFTFTGVLDDRAYRLYQSLFPTSLSNPNGCPARVTLFLQGGATDFSLAADLYETGRAELAVTSLTDEPRQYWKNVTYDELVTKAYGLKLAIHREAGVPLGHITGFRGPFLQPSSAIYEMLANASYGFEYDSTLAIRKRRLGEDVTWPFTLDYGWPEACAVEPCPPNPITGMWEFPVYTLIDLDGFDRINHTEFQPRRDRAAFKYLVQNFRTFYRRNRAPFMLSLRPEWLYREETFNATKRFITRLLSLKERDIYLLSLSDTLEWMKSPRDIPDSTNFTAWKCSRTDIDPAPVKPPPPSSARPEQEPYQCLSINGVLKCRGGNGSTPATSTPGTSAVRPSPRTIPPDPKSVPPESSTSSPTPDTGHEQNLSTKVTRTNNDTTCGGQLLVPADMGMGSVSTSCQISEFLIALSLVLLVVLQKS